MLLVGLISPLHQAIKLDLFKVVASWSLLRMHGGVLDRWELDVVLLLAVCELDLGRLKIAGRTQASLFLTELNAALFADLFVEVYHVGLSIVAVRLAVTVLIDEDLAP